MYSINRIIDSDSGPGSESGSGIVDSSKGVNTIKYRHKASKAQSDQKEKQLV